MTTNERCAICMKPDLRRLVEAGWNLKMAAPSIAAAFGNIPSTATILKHLHEHVDEGAADRTIPIPNARNMRERVSTLQQTLVEEVERRIAVAQEWAAFARAHGNPDADWSDRYNILDKDNQAAIASIIKMQGLTDKREIGKAAVSIDMAKLMLGEGGGLAPKRLSSGKDDEADVVVGTFKEIEPSGDTSGGSIE